MSFTIDVRRELIGCEVPDNLRDTLRYGMMYGFRGKEPYLMTHDKAAANYVRRIFPKHTFYMMISEIRTGKHYCLMPKDKLISIRFPYYESSINAEIAGDSDIEAGMFLRGVFFTGGSVNIQKAGYHFELALSTKEKCEELCRLITEHGMNVSISHRGRSYFLYCKNSENISDFLTFIGAAQSAMEIMNIKIIKEVRSNINRSVNCETANIDRTVRASAKQIEDIRFLLDKLGEDKLPDELREISRLRLENPDMSLRDLGMLAEPHISRSGVNHRFERLAKLADELRGNE
ncbi:MAG: DNA-binding protein WhiA [Ruminiclostridium sp.]|nr:DNA-binding protein WhiA [Ruminiclostridium sp.]